MATVTSFPVTLIKKGQFVFDPGKYKSVDKGLFDMLVDAQPGFDGEELPIVYYFKNKSEYAKEAGNYDISDDEPIYIDDKNQIFCFRRSRNEATDSEKDNSK